MFALIVILGPTTELGLMGVGIVLGVIFSIWRAIRKKS